MQRLEFESAEHTDYIFQVIDMSYEGSSHAVLALEEGQLIDALAGRW